MSSVLSLAEILEKTSQLKSKAEKIDFLKKNDSVPLRILLKIAFEPTAVFDLPEGPAPYTPSKMVDSQGMLYGRMNILVGLLKGNNPHVSAKIKDMQFVNLLESVYAKDAALLNEIKDKQFPYKGVTQKLIHEAFGEF